MKLKILTIVIFLSCCSLTRNFVNGISLKELKRISSPDKRVEAVLVETNGGATTSLGNAVFLVVPGEEINQDKLKYAVFNADHYRNVDIKWKSNKQLLISYNKARIFSYTNFWQSDRIDNWDYVVEIELQCLSSDSQLLEDDKHPMTH